MLWNIEQITGYRHLCVSEHWTDHRTDHGTDCWIQWINLTVSYIGQVRVVSLLYPPDASGGYHGFRGGTPPQCVDNFSLPLCSQKY